MNILMPQRMLCTEDEVRLPRLFPCPCVYAITDKGISLVALEKDPDRRKDVQGHLNAREPW
jgi:hypothetical protein